MPAAATEGSAAGLGGFGWTNSEDVDWCPWWTRAGDWTRKAGGDAGAPGALDPGPMSEDPENFHVLVPGKVPDQLAQL
jgi:hypothetical protein